MKNFFGIILTFIVCGCSGLEQSEQDKIRRQNSAGEVIFRKSEEAFARNTPPEIRKREKYPWEESYVGNLPKITKDFFRCKGSNLNPNRSYINDSKQSIYLSDCRGSEQHSLPIRNEKEFIYPILLELVNYLQKKTEKKVVITCGYRCPSHNTYADPSKEGATSKHMIGAEVDFYVQGMEDKPEEIIKLLLQFYRENPRYQGKKEFIEFARYDKSTDVSVHPWYNKEVMIKLYRKQEGRDLDNRHPYPYVSIQVRYDSETKERVIYSWDKAYKGFKRY